MNPIFKSTVGAGLPSLGNAFVKVHIKPFAQLLFSETRRNPEGALTKTGHIAFQLNATEFTSLQSFLGQPEDAERPGSIGHQPDDHTPVLRRDTIHTDMGGKDVEYQNLTRSALPQWAKQHFDHTPRSTGVGELTPQHLDALARVIGDEKFDLYSLRGDKPIDRSLLTAEDLRAFLIDGQVPRHAPNCVDFVKAVLVAWARLEGPPRAVMRFAASLADCRYPQDVGALAQAHFGADENGVIQFRPGKEVTAPECLDNKRFYSQFLDASGLSKEVFDKMCADLAAKGLIFGEIFEHDETWGTTFFSGLGQRLRACQPHEGVGAVCYHKDTYPGDITHVSMIAFSPSGDVAICHHESIAMSKDSPIDNLMHSTAGVPSNSYDTADIHKRVLGSDVKKLPIMASYESSGPPMVKFTSLGDFGALRDFNEETTRDAFTNAKEFLYATDPDQHLLEMKGAWRNGMHPKEAKDNRFPHEPLRLPPGEKDKTSAGAYTNNCAAYTLRCLQAGGCKDLPTSLGHVSELRLSEVADTLLQAGLMPCTDPKAAEKMDLAGYKYSKETGVTAHAGSFLALAYLWSNAAADLRGVYPADVPRIEVSEEKKEALEQKRKKQLDGIEKTISKHQASFKDMLKSSGMV